jgi:CRP-like cAMP-binding protein
MNDELSELNWLAVCTKNERVAVRRHADIVELAAGSVLIAEGEPARWFYAVLDGELETSTDDRHVAVVTSGQPVNELEVLRNEPSPVTVTCSTRVRLMAMGRREFLGMLDDIPGLARRLLLPHIPAATAPARRPSLVPVPAA